MAWKIAGIASMVLLVGCADSREASDRRGGGFAPENDAGASGCFRDADCAPGLRCEEFQCVASDGLPPEVEEKRTFLRPAASKNFVFALSPDGDSVAVVDPLTLAIRAVRLPENPVALEVVPGEDRVVVVSHHGRAISHLDVDAAATRLVSVSTPRRFPALSLSADGQWAVLWTPDGNVPDAGAEGVVGLVNVASLGAGEAPPVVEFAAGRRHTDVFFRMEGQVAKEAVIVGHQEIVIIELKANPEPVRISLPETHAQLVGREALSPPGGSLVLLRSLASADIGVLDVASRGFSVLSLPGVASDLDLTADGSHAVAVLRETSQLARFALPAGDDLQVHDVSLPGSDCPADVDPCLVAPGQAVLTPDGKAAAVFTNARKSESFGWLDFETGRFKAFSRLQKLVRTVGISPDGTHVIVLHRPDPNSTVADDYERRVDRAEGYSVVDLAADVAQLKLTDKVAPLEFVWALDGKHAAVTLRNDAARAWRVEAINLKTLIVSTLDLASAPQFAGPLPGLSSDARVWVTQEHSAGRISFVDLAARTVRTATGYELNSEIE